MDTGESYVELNGARIEREYLKFMLDDVRSQEWTSAEHALLPPMPDHVHCSLCGIAINRDSTGRLWRSSWAKWLCAVCYNFTMQSPDSKLLDRITINPEQCGGRPCIRGMRVRVTDILDLLAAGQTPEQVVSELPILELDDVRAALAYASRRLNHPRLVA